MQIHVPNTPVRVITHNVRYATKEPFEGEELWAVRAPRLGSQLNYTSRHINECFLCLQEVLCDQLDNILELLNTTTGDGVKDTIQEVEWSYIGVGRDDGRKRGEYSPIIYRPGVWELIEFETFWLSQTPRVPSKGWDAASIRILTLGVFAHRSTKQIVIAANTHLDDQGQKARIESATLICSIMESYQRRNYGAHVFLAGDLNSTVDNEAWKILNQEQSPVRDMRQDMHKALIYGNENTFTGFGKETPEHIDFIHIGKRGWKTNGYGVLSNRFDDGVYISDHRAVVGDFELL